HGERAGATCNSPVRAAARRGWRRVGGLPVGSPSPSAGARALALPGAAIPQARASEARSMASPSLPSNRNAPEDAKILPFAARGAPIGGRRTTVAGRTDRGWRASSSAGTRPYAVLGLRPARGTGALESALASPLAGRARLHAPLHCSLSTRYRRPLRR